MKNLVKLLGDALEKIDHLRDELLFLFIKPHWPKKISPNQITYLRVIIGLLLFIFLFFLGITNKALIFTLFFAGVLTDLFDGSVARGLNMETEFGAMLDPTADRILILPIAIYSLFQGEKWLLLFLLLIEIINALVSIFYKSKEAYSGANIFGKTKMVLQSVVFIVILIIWPKAPSEFFIDLLWISIIFSILSIFNNVLYLKDKGYIKNKIINKQLYEAQSKDL